MTVVGDRRPSVDVTQWETIPEVIAAARARLSEHVWDYSAGGAETEVTLRRNRAALERIAFRPRVLRDVHDRRTTTTVLGTELSLPVMLAPIGSVIQFDPDGALASARAAEAAGTAAVIGSLSSPSLEVVRGGTRGPLFLQMYYNGDRGWTERLVRRAEDAGYLGLCLTVDAAVYGRRGRDIAHRFRPASGSFVPKGTDVGPDHSRRDSATWGDVEWLRGLTDLPLVLKGITCADDAGLAVEAGADVVYVSNHGGRQLDHMAATIEVLPEVVETVGGRAEVLVDGGFTHGTDVLKALALGARAVLVGKLMAWGLAAGGAAGLARVLEILRLEISTAMGTLGITDVSELSSDFLRPGSPVPPDLR